MGLPPSALQILLMTQIQYWGNHLQIQFKENVRLGGNPYKCVSQSDKVLLCFVT